MLRNVVGKENMKKDYYKSGNEHDEGDEAKKNLTISLLKSCKH